MSLTVTTDNGEELSIPIDFKKYSIIRKIGSGSSSVVFEVKKKLDPTHYSCKVLSRKSLDPVAIGSIEQELRVQSQLQHPNILSIKDVVYTNDLIFIIMDLCNHGDLMTVMTRDSVMCGLMFVRKIIYQIISALDYLHSKNIAHRDIKPDNIMLDSNYDAKLADFGCCETQLNQSLSGVGTLFYISPESLTGQCVDGKAADIWSLGIVIFALSVKFFPWTSQTEDGVIAEIIKGDITIPDTVPTDLTQLIQMCCRLRPQDRATTTDLLNFINSCPYFDFGRSSFKESKSLRITMSSPSILLKRQVQVNRPDDPKLFLKRKLGPIRKNSGSISSSLSSAVVHLPPLIHND